MDDKLINLKKKSNLNRFLSSDEQSLLSSADDYSDTSSISSNHPFYYNVCCDDCECTHDSYFKSSTLKKSNDVVLFRNFKHTEKAFEFLNELRK
jgi:hypothetical protein